jgi:hypothetical protein
MTARPSGTRCRTLLPSITLLALSVGATAAGSRTWVIEGVDCPKQFSAMADRSLRLDADGHPHIAYGEDHLYYAWHDGSSWHPETADSSYLVGKHASLDLDQEGHPHISYYDETAHDLKYAYKDAGGWHCQTVDSEGDVGGSTTTIAVDASGRPRIAYYDASNHLLKYACYNGSAWAIDVVTETGYHVYRASMALDSGSLPHIGVESNNGLAYAYKDAAGWHVELPGSSCSGYVSIALDEGGLPRIAFSGNALMYAYKDGGGWHFQTVDNTSAGNHCSLALDSSGNPRVAYTRAEYYAPAADVGYAYRDASGSWHVDWFCSTWGGISLVVGADDLPRISCYGGYCESWSGDERGLKYLSHDGTGWNVETVDRAGDVGACTSISLVSGVAPYVSYYDFWHGAVRLAERDSLSWHTELVESLGVPNPWTERYTSIAIDSAECLHVAYCAWPGLAYAVRDGAGWQFEAVDSADVSHCSLTLDGAGRPHVSYSADSNLRHGWRDVAGWHLEEVVQGGVPGETSLAVDAHGGAHISFHHVDVWTKLKYATRTDSVWQIEVIDDGTYVGSVSSLAVDTDGCPHVSYTGGGDTYLKHAWRDAGGWHIEVVAGPHDGGYLSQCLDTENRPHVAYRADGTLKFARCVGAGWSIETVDDRGAEGAYCALALDGEGNAHISYYDADLRDLMYARSSGGAAADRSGLSSMQQGSIRLDWAGPNPSSGPVSVGFRLAPAADTQDRHVRLAVYDAVGRIVATLLNESRPPGAYSVPWDLRGADGDTAPPGLYILRLVAGSPESQASARLVVVQ